MNINNTLTAAFAAALLTLSAVAQSAPQRDCVLEGTVRKQSAISDDKVYVAFHSARPAERGASCRFRRDEKLRFKAPTGSDIRDAAPGSKVEYRYTEERGEEPTWQLRNISSDT